jgi:hypothetical protein
VPTKDKNMKRNTVITLAAAISLTFGAGAFAGTMMSKADYKDAKKAIEAEYKSAKAACDSLKDNPKDICQAEAKGKENVALAELEVTHQPSDKARSAARIARAEATYAVAKEKCDEKTGNEKDVCVKEAKSARTAAKADANAQLKVAVVRKDAADDKRDAEYAVAKEKCDALVGGTKDQCVKDAKAHYGKS